MTAQNIWALSKGEVVRQRLRAQATVTCLGILETDFVLDIGCCEGFIASHLLKSSFFIGTDIIKAALLIAKQKVRQSNIDFVLADVTSLPFQAGSFDKITTLEVLEHLAKEKQEKLCSEIDGILKEKGILLVSTPYKEQNRYATIINCAKFTAPWGHLCSFDEEKITRLLPNNYSLVSHYHLPNVPFISLSCAFQKLPFKLWSMLNNLLGRIREGYWVILKFKKRHNVKNISGKRENA